MADVRPFHGLRYDPAVVGDWGAVLGPPYDIITPADRAALLARSPYQITQIEAAAGAEGVAEAAALLQRWRREGVLRADSARPSYYLDEHHFRHQGKARSRLCLFAAVRLTPWEAGDVRPHEWTMTGPKAERLSLRQQVRADISPVFGLLPDRGGRVAKALADARRIGVNVRGVDANGDEHILRIVQYPAIVDAQRAACWQERIYIADGHHRYESALEHRDQQAAAANHWTGDEPENFVLMGLVLADDPGLIVGAPHRLVHRPAPPGLLAAIEERFEVREAGTIAEGVETRIAQMAEAGPARPTIGAVGLADDRRHLLLADERTQAALPASLQASWRDLDAALLQYAILEPLLGIDSEALKGGEAVTYSHDPQAALAAVREGSASCAFFLNPPTLAQIFATADSGDRMPQKSTYFTPKLPTGVVIYPFDQEPQGVG